jgi:hypothetical protein
MTTEPATEAATTLPNTPRSIKLQSGRPPTGVPPGQRPADGWDRYSAVPSNQNKTAAPADWRNHRFTSG